MVFIQSDIFSNLSCVVKNKVLFLIFCFILNLLAQYNEYFKIIYTMEKEGRQTKSEIEPYPYPAA